MGLAATRPTEQVGSKGLSFHMQQKLWTPAFVWALLKAQLDFLQGGTEGDGTLGNQEGASFDFCIANKPSHTTITHVWILEMPLSQSQGRA